MELTVNKVSYQGGTIAVLTGIDEHGIEWQFGADHRPAAAIAHALLHGEDVVVNVESWQLLGNKPRPKSRDRCKGSGQTVTYPPTSAGVVYCPWCHRELKARRHPRSSSYQYPHHNKPQSQ